MTALVELGGVFVDTRAGDLTLTLDADDQPALATCAGRLGPFDIQLRLLGASHQVVVDRPQGRLRETLACLPGVEPALPTHWVRGDYTFSSDVRVHDEESMRMIVGHLESQVRPTDERALGLIGSYPGRPLAVTAVRAQHDPASGVLQWDTWHSYPQSGEVVVTTSTIRERTGDTDR
ncbi:MAG TPA: DUF2617 family protein [Gordonia sp. (in: high G+C Gram-positive bacteria)]|uniref:DUF2617 family protein n=1 Tax=unclassified Gordonia (in: high G+C Gram-positive bacteria) TaxID=2657482 RepID=UPI000FBE9BEE|nr:MULTISPECIES: DUF2617 family protein [unclassified Gordonia (in: high G+C Gram-positive bacteria)]RUP37777.1 MAG: DUF2617 family protein [Gordonia sp. (in: high G+C Gram-positive bacteria)]HNP55374.1 DUF2617 family protein [Gordonia sp. (in: high G+C Gram-positive bacteria)]HRC50054.1 DUF2617 family protein [Gordonia sp. (in: high G+C Gram-positive bacteria)]